MEEKNAMHTHHNQHRDPAHTGHGAHAGHDMGQGGDAKHADHGAHAAHEHPAAPDQHAGHSAHATHEHPAAPDQHAGHGAHATHEHPAAPDQHAGHGAHGVDHSGHEQMFRRRLWICLVLSIPVLLFSADVQSLLPFEVPFFPGSQWITPVFSIIVFVYGGLPFLRMAVPELRSRRPGMMMLISLAISVAFIYSLAALIFRLGSTFFWELVTLIDIMLLGHWLEMRSVRQASGALNELAKLMPDTAERIRKDGALEVVPVDALREGDLVLVRPGASVPADAEVEEGESSVNEAMITGESRPVDKEPGSNVIGGTINGDGSLRVRVTATGDETALAGIMRLVEQAQQSKSNTQILADRAAGWLFYVALVAAFVTAIAWTAADGFDSFVIARVATVLVIACPHALGLAVPLVVAITTAMGANNGILVRDRLALERAREIDVVMFDKTGTLTEGEFGVAGMAVVDGWTEERALGLAAAVEGDSEHTLARGIRHAAEKRQLVLPRVTDFEAIKGRGVRARLDGEMLHVGGPNLLEQLEAALPEGLRDFTRGAEAGKQTVVYLLENHQVVAAFGLADLIRPESRETVDSLKEMGIEVAMITGDSEAVAKAVAAELGLDQYFAEVLPELKDQKVTELQNQGKRVAMVGDGVNDAPALARADVGIAIGSGTDVAVESAGIILVRSNPLDIVKIVRLSRASYRKMIQNLWWAAGYNIFALPLAAGVLAPIGILLSPAVGAVLMSLSTVIVAINAQLLRRVNLESATG